MLESAALALAVKILSPILVGVITPFALDGLKHLNATLDKSPAYVKQTLAIGIASVGTAATHLVGVELPTDLAAWDGDIIKALVSGFLAIAIKQHQQLKKAKANPGAV
jgi:hypothetical protein